MHTFFNYFLNNYNGSVCMKKIFSVCFLASSLLVISPFAAAQDEVKSLDNDPIKICPLLSEIQNSTVKEVKPAQGKDRYVVSMMNQFKYDQDKNTYTDYTFKVVGVKAADAGDAITKVKAALSSTAAQPMAIRIESGDDDYNDFNCVYDLGFSQSGNEYNGVYPASIAEI